MYPHDGMHSLYKPGDIVQASFAFKKDRYEDLPFMQNDKLEIIGVAKDPNWAHARNVSGETGLIPLNYVRSVTTVSTNLTIHSWYHGPISRKASEEIMHGHPVGSFLVRESDLFPGDLTLCLVGPPTSHFDNNEFDAKVSVPIGKAPAKKPPTFTNVQHYRIICRQPQDVHPSVMAYNSSITEYSLDEYDWFPNLPDLIKYYTVPDSGLVAPLLYPVVDLQRKRLNQLRNGGWIIRQGDLTLGDSIGRGEFGEVHKATYRNQQVAVKIYKKTACKLAITYEASLMSTVSHRNVVAFVGLVYEPDDAAIYVLTEYIANGNLLTYLHSRTRNQIGQLTKLQFTVDACLGLEYLERRRIIHRDIAARNILLSGQADRLTAKVADFGMARHLDEPSLTGSPPGRSPTAASSRVSTRYPTPHSPAPTDQVVLHDQAAIPVKWTAPEAVRDRTFSSKSDVWSFGILMWEIYSYGRIPYPRLMANQVIRQLATGYRMKPPEECPADVYSLMTRTWRLNPNDRPNFSSILGELLELRQTCKSREEGFAQPVEVSQQQRHSRAFTLPRRSENDRRSSWERNDCLEQGWTDSITDPESDCYDCMEEQPAARTGVTETTMSRSFTNTPTASYRAAPPSTTALENTRRNVFCLPKFERFQS